MRQRCCLRLQLGQCLLWCMSSLLSRSWCWSFHRHGWSWVVLRLSDMGEMKISVKFSSHHMKIKGCNCWQWPCLTGGKRAFLSTSMFGGWLYSYWPNYPNCQHAPYDGYNQPQLPALSHSCVHRDNCLLWVDHECLSGGTCLLSFHTTAVKSPLVVTWMSPHFNLCVLGLRSLGIPFLCSLTIPQQKIFFSSNSSYR